MLLGVILIIVILLPAVGSLPSGNRDQDCYPVFKGTEGQNGWFISPLNVSFVYDPQYVIEIQFWLNESWIPYDGPFNITEKGELPLFKWRYRTIENGGEWIYDQCICPVKIDFDKPSLCIDIERKGFFFKEYIVTAIVSDNTSGMDHVEFFLNGQLQFNDAEMPFQWTFRPILHEKNLTFKVCAYDVAGNYRDDQEMQSNVYSKSLPRNAAWFLGFYLIKSLSSFVTCRT